MKKAYALYGKEENLCIYEDNACHGYTQPLAVEAASFFCRVFGVEKRDSLHLNALPDEQLQATGTGNVKGDFPDAKTIPDETDRLAAELKQNRRRDETRDWLWKKVLYERIPWAARPRIAEPRYQMRIGEYVGKSVMWWVQKNLMAYGVLISRGQVEDPAAFPVVVALWDNGTKAIAEHEDWIKAACAEGKQVLVVALPGVGNIEQAFLWGWNPYRAAYGTMYKMCCDLLYMDDSMAAMQTYHLLRTVVYKICAVS